jgi:hypothetical protein
MIKREMNKLRTVIVELEFAALGMGGWSGFGSGVVAVSSGKSCGR